MTIFLIFGDGLLAYKRETSRVTFPTHNCNQPHLKMLKIIFILKLAYQNRVLWLKEEMSMFQDTGQNCKLKYNKHYLFLALKLIYPIVSCATERFSDIIMIPVKLWHHFEINHHQSKELNIFNIDGKDYLKPKIVL
jgi:hypothetical protein